MKIWVEKIILYCVWPRTPYLPDIPLLSSRGWGWVTLEAGEYQEKEPHSTQDGKDDVHHPGSEAGAQPCGTHTFQRRKMSLHHDSHCYPQDTELWEFLSVEGTRVLAHITELWLLITKSFWEWGRGDEKKQLTHSPSSTMPPPRSLHTPGPSRSFICTLLPVLSEMNLSQISIFPLCYPDITWFLLSQEDLGLNPLVSWLLEVWNDPKSLHYFPRIFLLSKSQIS